MSTGSARSGVAALLALAAVVGPGPGGRMAAAWAQPAASHKSEGSATLLPGANSRDPVSVEAAKLDYFDKEQKLVYTGDVVAKQGDSTMRASVLTIFLTKGAKDAEKAPDAPMAGGKDGGNSVRRMEATGPVTVVSKDEVGTGDNGVYDKADNKITLTGNVTLSQGTNIIKGDKLVYDMNNGQAHVSSGQTQGRVRSVFTPGSGAPGGEPVRKGRHGGATRNDASAR